MFGKTAPEISNDWKSKFSSIRACAAGAGGYDGPLLKMREREIILLDARLESVIEPHAFRAVLSNGHGFTAYVAIRDREKKSPGIDESVKVEMSPYNMNAGRIVL